MGSIILSTWAISRQPNLVGWKILQAGGSSLDAVEAACREAESDLTNHTVGKSGYPDASGRVSLDASIMLSPSRCGAVAFIRNFEHPISIARAVMDRTNHIMLIGEGAEEFARQHGFEPASLLTDQAQRAWTEWRSAHPKSGPSGPGASQPTPNIEDRNTHDTIGVLAIDTRGTIAGACSTSGLAFKLPGRVGDSPIIGHGLYVDPTAGAAVATGHGELVMSVCGSFFAVELLRRGASPIDAATEVLDRIRKVHQLTPQDQVGLIVLQKNGEWALASLQDGFQVMVRDVNREELV